MSEEIISSEEHSDEESVEDDDDPSGEGNSGDSTSSDVIHPPMFAVKFNCESKVLEILIEWNISLRNFSIEIIRIDVSVFEEPVEEFTGRSTEIHHIKKQVTLILRIR